MGAWVAVVWLSLLLPAALTACQSARKSSRYEKPAVYGGLFYLVNPRDDFDPRALVISYDDGPIPPKANEPEAPTEPGFYLTYEERCEFERIEVIRRSVYFMTRRRGGVSYGFVGTAGWEVHPDLGVPVPFIKGTLTKFKNGRVLKKERVKFAHAVIL